VGSEMCIRDRAGEVCERFSEVHLVDEDGSVVTVPTYRGEGQCFG